MGRASDDGWKHRIGVAVLVAAVMSTVAVTAPPGQTIAGAATACTRPGDLNLPAVKMTVVNDTGLRDDEVFVALTGHRMGGFADWGAQPSDLINTSVPLSCLPADPGDPSGHTRYFMLGQGISAGLLWVSLGAPITSGLPNVQPSLDTTTTRFANVEFAYPGQGDMTNVDQFSFPIDLRATDATGGTVESTYRADTCTIVRDLHEEVSRYNTAVDSGAFPGAQRARWAQIVQTDASGDFVRVLAPKQRARQLDQVGGAANPYAQGWPSLLPYIRSLAGRTIAVKGLFTPGAGSPYVGQTGWYAYRGTFAANGDLTLSGTIGASLTAGPGGAGSFAGASMSIDAISTMRNASGEAIGVDGLAPGIYDQNSQYRVNGLPRNGWTSGTPDPAAPNDVYNSIYRDLVSAFTYGYWGGVYGDDNAGYWVRFEPPAAPSGGREGFAKARPAGSEPFLPFSIFSDVMYRYSDHYNMPYGENYGSGAPDRRSPLLEVPVGGEWRMTIRGDGPADCLGGPSPSPNPSPSPSPDPGFARPDLAIGTSMETLVGSDIYAPTDQSTPLQTVARGRATTFFIHLGNDGTAVTPFALNAGAAPRAPTRIRRTRFRVTYLDAAGANIGAELTDGSYVTSVPPGEGAWIRARVHVGQTAPVGALRWWGVTASEAITGRTDSVRFGVVVQ